MTYTWNTQFHNTTAGRSRVQLETWAHTADGWENIDIVVTDSLNKACEVATSIRENRAFLDRFQSPVIIAAVRFAPRGHHRLITWHGTYVEGDTNA